jgi:glycosyltransferase involved in cell wall biosynthesis
MLAPPGSPHSRRPLEWLLDAACDVVFVAEWDPRPEGCPGYRFARLPRGGERVLRPLLGRRLARRVALALLQAQYHRLARAARPDVVHVHWVDQRAWNCAAFGLRPLVLSVWGSDINRSLLPGADARQRDMVAEALREADVVLVDAPAMASRCGDLAGGPVRTEPMHMGIDTSRFAPRPESERAAWRRELDIPEDTFVVFSPRGWARLYRNDLILEAFAAATRAGIGAAVLIVKTSYGSPETPGVEVELRHQAEALGIANLVRFVGSVDPDRLPALYSAADVVVNVPEMDTFPMVFLEAAACERPVLTVALDTYAGTFATERFTIVEPTIDGLAGALARTRSLPPDAAGLAGARHAVVEEYSEGAARAKLLDVYARLAPEADRTW